MRPADGTWDSQPRDRSREEVPCLSPPKSSPQSGVGTCGSQTCHRSWVSRSHAAISIRGEVGRRLQLLTGHAPTSKGLEGDPESCHGLHPDEEGSNDPEGTQTAEDDPDTPEDERDDHQRSCARRTLLQDGGEATPMTSKRGS